MNVRGVLSRIVVSGHANVKDRYATLVLSLGAEEIIGVTCTLSYASSLSAGRVVGLTVLCETELTHKSNYYYVADESVAPIRLS